MTSPYTLLPVLGLCTKYVAPKVLDSSQISIIGLGKTALTAIGSFILPNSCHVLQSVLLLERSLDQQLEYPKIDL